MHATDIRDLMDSALEEGAIPRALRELVDDSAELAEEWERQRVVHHMLRTDPLVEPPMDFSMRVMGRLEAEERRAPMWRAHLLRIAAMLVGTGAVAWSSVGLSRHWQLADLGPTLWTLTRATAFGLLAMGDAMLQAASGSSVGWLLSGALALTIAAAWFGVLVLPRSTNALQEREAGR